MLHHKLHNKKGFTMIELLVVLLIIGILAAVAAPMYLSHTEKAKASEAVGAMSLIRSAEREYKTINGSYMQATSNAMIENDPGASTPGLGVTIGAAQYFSVDSYRVAVPPGSWGGTVTGVTAPVDFLITTTGADSKVLSTNNVTGVTSGARNYANVANYTVQMDNSGQVLYTADGANWKKYNQ